MVCEVGLFMKIYNLLVRDGYSGDFNKWDTYLLKSWFICEIAADMGIASIMSVPLLVRRTGLKACVLVQFPPRSVDSK